MTHLFGVVDGAVADGFVGRSPRIERFGYFEQRRRQPRRRGIRLA